jgi:SAM-dependent methyltransferase
MKETGKFGLSDESDRIESMAAANTALDDDEQTFFLIPRRNVESFPEQYIAVPATPPPPEHLRIRVGGHADMTEYLRTGHLMARSIFELIRSRTIAVRENARVLDFGCGTGRLATWLRGRHSGWDLYGTDVDAEAIAWAQKNLTNVARFACNLVAPPLS